MSKSWAVLGILLLGCSNPLQPDCAPLPQVALNIEVLQAVSGDPITDPIISVSRDGRDESQFVTPGDAPGTFVLWGSGGVYELSVARQGFKTWSNAIRVEEEGCDVHAVAVSVQLEEE